MSIACVIVCSMAIMCSAYTVHDKGVIHAYNGTYWYDKAWVDFSAGSEYNYYVKVFVKKNNVRYGYNRTTVLKNHRSTCYSLAEAGSGGTCDWTKEVKSGVG